MSTSAPNSLLRQISADYDVEWRQIEIERGHTVELVAVRDINVLLDRIDPDTAEEEERLPYWAELWPAAVGLARYLLHCPIPKGSEVLDLGCGLGLAGIFAAHLGARVLACDLEPDALRFTRCNAELNGVCDSMTFRLLDWRAPDLPRRFRYIIGSDILYEKEEHPYLEMFLDHTLAAGGICLLSDPNRTVGREFVPRLLDRGYRHTQWTTVVIDGVPRHTVNVDRFVK